MPRLDVYGFVYLAEFQLYVDAGLLVYLQLERGDSRSPKTAVSYRNRIVSGRKAVTT